jgi:NADH:ubiquinone oxidoreductase subunit C
MANRSAAWAPLRRPMNLQLFAEAEQTGAENTETSEDSGKEQQQQQPGTLTMEDVMRIVQSESDKRVTQALAKQKKEFEKQMSLSGLDEQERKSREKDQHIEELTASLREAQMKMNHLELVRTLAGRNLPVEFADLIVVGEDLEEAQKRVDALDAVFKKAVEDAVNRRIAGAPPAKGSGSVQMTKEQYRRLSLAEQQALATSNPELYKRMNE